MKRMSAIHSMFFLFFILFIISFGLKWFSLDIPYEYKSTTVTKTTTLRTYFGGEVIEQEIKLGNFNSWTSFQIHYTSSVGEAGVNMGPTSSGRYMQSGWTQQGSLNYRIYASKEVSLYLIYRAYATYPSQLGEPVTTTIIVNISINQPKILPTNFIFISMIPILGYLGIAKKSNESWVDNGKYQLDGYERLDARRVYKNNMNLCDLCGKERIEVIPSSRIGTNSNRRYCSNTCKYIDDKEISILLYYTMIFFSIFAPILFLIDIFGLIFIIYIIETDSDELRFKNYEKAKQLEKEKKNVFKGQLKKEKIDHEPMKSVEELGESFPVCCYQTARLGEVFCECGRTVPQRLIDFLVS